MHKLKLMAAVAAVLVASPALAQEITVWDVNVRPAIPTYYDAAKAAFEKAHPGATLTFVAQPDAEYYTLLGTALASKTGPDVIWANGGAQAKNLIGGLIPLDDKLPDLISQGGRKVGLHRRRRQALLHPDDAAGPRRLLQQGLYKDVGLDPNKPPTTWAEVTKMCDAFKASGQAPAS